MMNFQVLASKESLIDPTEESESDDAILMSQVCIQFFRSLDLNETFNLDKDQFISMFIATLLAFQLGLGRNRIKLSSGLNKL